MEQNPVAIIYTKRSIKFLSVIALFGGIIGYLVSPVWNRENETKLLAGISTQPEPRLDSVVAHLSKSLNGRSTKEGRDMLTKGALAGNEWRWRLESDSLLELEVDLAGGRTRRYVIEIGHPERVTAVTLPPRPRGS